MYRLLIFVVLDNPCRTFFFCVHSDLNIGPFLAYLRITVVCRAK
jgi:hypothetical protein